MLTALALSLAIPVVSEPLAPTSKWTVEYEENMCVMSRGFGGPPEQVRFAIRPIQIGQNYEVILIRPGATGALTKSGKGKLTFPGRSEVVDTDYARYRLEKQDKTLFRFSIVEADIQTMLAAPNFEVDFGDDGIFRLAPAEIGKAFGVLQNCQNELLADWGVDKDALSRIVTPAKLKSGAITNNDYPASALRQSQSGITVTLVTISERGVITECRIIQTSAVSDLDKATCSLMKERFKFDPALDKDGKPVPSWQTRAVRWQSWSN